jgi:hypothetical protein
MSKEEQAISLARLVLETLAAQQRYFKDRTRENVMASKQLEVRLLREAEKVLNGDLFV